MNNKVEKLFLNIHNNSYPFDWKTPLGYLVAFVSEYAWSLSAASVCMQIFVFIFGTSYFFITFANDIAKDLAGLNMSARPSDGHREAKILKRFCEIVHIYSDIKE